MKRLLATPVLTIFVLFLITAPAFGQIGQDGELNLFFGVSSHTKNQFQIGAPQAAPPINAKFELGDSLRYGFRFNVANQGHWGEEFYYSYEDNRSQYVLQGVPVATVNLPIQVHNFGANALFYFTENERAKTKPFVSFGLGGTIYKPTQEAKATAEGPANRYLSGFGQSNTFNFHYGIGFKQRLGRVLGLRMDLNHFIGRNPSFSMPRESDNPGEAVLPAAGAIHNVEATGGLIFYFGR